MRLLFKELKKLLNPLLVLILALFSAAFIYTILAVTVDSFGSSDYDFPFMRELVSEFGNELSLDEWDAFLEKHERISDSIREQGIGTVEYPRDESSYRLTFNLQVMDNYIREKECFRMLADESDYDAYLAENPWFERSNKDAAARTRDIYTRDHFSLLPHGVVYLAYNDIVRMLILAAVWCVVLVLPYIIKERIRNVRPVQLVTQKGRGVFRTQAGACALFGLIIGVLLNLVYALLLWSRGIFDFISCDINSYIDCIFWVDMSLGNYLLIHAAAVILFSVCAALTAYFIGRLARSYIAGIGLALPAAAAVVWGFLQFFRKPLQLDNMPHTISLIKPFLVLLIFAAISAAVLIMLKRDKVRDIL